MHLLATTSGVIDGSAEAVDLGQTPGDIVILSAADSELAALAAAQDARPTGSPSLRLVNVMALSHNLSVDTWIDKTALGARLIVVRLLGGKPYWPYGVEQLVSLAQRSGIGLALLPGGVDPDPELTALSTLPASDCETLRRYFAAGGIANATALLIFAASLLKGRREAPPPMPLPRAGLYWPGSAAPALDDIRKAWLPGAPVAPIIFYRALIEGGLTAAPVDALIEALRARNMNPLPFFVSGLKDTFSARLIGSALSEVRPAVILNATGFAVAGFGDGDTVNPLAAFDCPVLQAVFSGSGEAQWRDNPQGLSARDLAMNVVLPELDGRIMTRAVSFKADNRFHELTQCRVVTYAPLRSRIDYVADLAANWGSLAATDTQDRRIAIVLANYPNRDGRIGNGVGYDTPASTIAILRALEDAGYQVENTPSDGNALIRQLQDGPTNRKGSTAAATDATLPLGSYSDFFATLPEPVRASVTARWGTPGDDPFVRDGAFKLAVRQFGNVVVGIQPARGYNVDPKNTYHDPALVPPHGYLAFYCWLRQAFGAHAIIHNGKHGNLEWLPGKANALSETCFPEVVLGPVPQLYPFIVNDPGEGTQAKRRTSAVIIDHLTPPLARAESYGPLRELEALVDEYYLASGLDRRRLGDLKRQILDQTRSTGIDIDAGIAGTIDEDQDQALQQLDTWLCDLKEAQIRDGLHVLGSSPEGRLETDLVVALARSPRRLGEGGDASLIRALAADLGLAEWDPFACELGAPWLGPRNDPLLTLSDDPWRSNGDTVERLELLAAALVAGKMSANAGWCRTVAVLQSVDQVIRPAVRACGEREIAALLAGLDGRFVAPGPSGAPTRGRVDVLPTGRNFYSVDNRAVPTPTAWNLGERSAGELLARYFQDNGHYPAAMGLSVWGTSNMRTGGDDIAQALALIGVKPVWDTGSWRLTGFEVVPLAKLGRPRVDVTLRISGFFRDAFPAQIELFDKAVRAVGALDEGADDNPIAARMRQEAGDLIAAGVTPQEADQLAGHRIFGSKPGAYGAGLQAMFDEKIWTDRADLASVYITWGAYAYGAQANGTRTENTFQRRLSRIDSVIHNQDNREHDLLDSDDYYQFEGGMTAAVEQTSGKRPSVYHNDHSRPERPVIRSLEEEISRVMRSRVVNPKWIAGVMRHGYKGGFEIAATVDYMFAFAATTGAVRTHHFDLAYDAYIGDDTVRDFLEANNPQALREMADRFQDAISRGLWTPKSNSAYIDLGALTGSSAP